MLNCMLNGKNPIVSVGALMAPAFPWEIICRRRAMSVEGMEAWSATPLTYAFSPGVAVDSQVTSTVEAYCPGDGWHCFHVHDGFEPQAGFAFKVYELPIEIW